MVLTEPPCAGQATALLSIQEQEEPFGFRSSRGQAFFIEGGNVPEPGCPESCCPEPVISADPELSGAGGIVINGNVINCKLGCAMSGFGYNIMIFGCCASVVGEICSLIK